ncbi:MAG: hypothetical protein ACT4P4_25790 [Betaproteobacteria bacterium]
MSIRSTADIERYLDVWFLEPAAAPDGSPPAMRDGSMPAPPGMKAVRSGLRLPEWEAQATPEDRAAVRAFIEARGTAMLADCLDAVERAKEQLRSSGDALARVLTAWHDAGVHPLQEERGATGSRSGQVITVFQFIIWRSRSRFIGRRIW